jgi:hypothetical protein
MTLKRYIVMVARFYWADDEDHALEQFENELGEAIASEVNVIEEVDES